MLWKNFLVTGTGRCGTRFLANLMNKSSTWNVMHEPPPTGIEYYTTKKDIERTNLRFAHHHYGEVNSMLRRIFLNLNVSKRGIIIRNPEEVFLSIANRRDPAEPWLSRFKESLVLTKKYSSIPGILHIDFHKMTSDVSYVKEILDWFGIKDVSVEPEHLKTKINRTENKKYKSVDDFPSKIKRKLKEILNDKRFNVRSQIW